MNTLSNEQKNKASLILLNKFKNKYDVKDLLDKLPTTKDVEKALGFNLTECIKEKKEEDSNKPINLSFMSYSSLLPDYEKKIMLNGYSYNSVSLYVFFMLYSLLPKYSGIKEVYNTFGNNFSLSKMEEYYFYDREKLIENQLKANLSFGLIHKYKDIYSQEVLRLTDPRKLYYNVSNKIFGNNFIGKETMKIRQEIIDSMPSMIVGQLTISNASYLLVNDPFLKEWCKMRISGYYKNVMRFITRFNSFEDDKIKSVINMVLKYIYNPYNLTGVNFGNIPKDIPEYFIKICDDSVPALTPVFKKTFYETSYIYIMSLIHFGGIYNPDIETFNKLILNSQIKMNRKVDCNSKLYDEVLKKSYKCLPNAYLNLQKIIYSMDNEISPLVKNNFKTDDLELIEQILLNSSFNKKGLGYNNITTTKEKPKY